MHTLSGATPYLKHKPYKVTNSQSRSANFRCEAVENLWLLVAKAWQSVAKREGK